MKKSYNQEKEIVFGRFFLRAQVDVRGTRYTVRIYERSTETSNKREYLGVCSAGGISARNTSQERLLEEIKKRLDEQPALKNKSDTVVLAERVRPETKRLLLEKALEQGFSSVGKFLDQLMTKNFRRTPETEDRPASKERRDLDLALHVFLRALCRSEWGLDAKDISDGELIKWLNELGYPIRKRDLERARRSWETLHPNQVPLRDELKRFASRIKEKFPKFDLVRFFEKPRQPSRSRPSSKA